MKKYLAIFCILNIVTGTVYAGFWQNKAAELKELAQQITHLKTQLESAHRQKSAVIHQLKKTETAIAKSSRNLDKIKSDLLRQQTILTELKTTLAKEQTSLYQQQSQLKQELRSAYMFDNTNYLKLLLNQQDPNELSQTMTYYRYLMTAQVAAIDKVKRTIARIEQQQQEINARTVELHNLQHQAEREQKHLLQQKASRQHLLNKISAQIEDNAEALEELSENQHSLEGVITKLKAAEAAAKVHFPALHGHLPWPLHGRILASFGSSIENSELTWKGIIISASDGEAVQAVAPGKVIFANWLKGFGFLIILDHGNGYMTLYGRNESLYKKVGNVVQTGELIARAGRSGGFASSGLYFEIRRNGVALNPLAWLS